MEHSISNRSQRKRRSNLKKSYTRARVNHHPSFPIVGYWRHRPQTTYLPHTSNYIHIIVKATSGSATHRRVTIPSGSDCSSSGSEPTTRLLPTASSFATSQRFLDTSNFIVSSASVSVTPEQDKKNPHALHRCHHQLLLRTAHVQALFRRSTCRPQLAGLLITSAW